MILKTQKGKEGIHFPSPVNEIIIIIKTMTIITDKYQLGKKCK